MNFRPFIPMALAAVILTGCIQTETPAPKVGVVDTARVYHDCAAGKAGVKFLEGLHASMQSELNSLQEELQKKPDDPALQEKLQEQYMSFQQRMNAEQQQVVTLINDVLQRTLDAYRTQKGLNVLLGAEAALSYDKSIDVTPEIIAEMDKQKVDFKPVMEALDTPDSVKAEEAAKQGGDKPAAADKPAEKKPADKKPADKGDKAPADKK